MKHLLHIKKMNTIKEAYEYAFDNCTDMISNDDVTTFLFYGEGEAVFHGKPLEQQIEDDVRDWDAQ